MGLILLVDYPEFLTLKFCKEIYQIAILKTGFFSLCLTIHVSDAILYQGLFALTGNTDKPLVAPPGIQNLVKFSFYLNSPLISKKSIKKTKRGSSTLHIVDQYLDFLPVNMITQYICVAILFAQFQGDDGGSYWGVDFF